MAVLTSILKLPPFMNTNLSGKSFILMLVSSLFCGASLVNADDKDPHPDAILEAARFSAAQVEEHTMEGYLRHLESNKRFPFKMTIRKRQIAYMFTKNPQHIIVLDLMDERHRLRESKAGRPYVDVPTAAYSQEIRGTGVNYVDISMHYLYWPNAKFEATDTVANRLTWRVSVPNPSKSGPYTSMRIWVDKNTGALMRVQGLNANGKVTKQMEVRDVKKVRGVWEPKRIDIVTIDPNSGRAVSRTQMKF